ncbi:hypothetical protein FSW04_13985 [Baekduia soli]|uniref:ABM domain-containing protein n=1 Tax=Baekduia soli TaxID=496014 RepID=A0A5B8U618_9ACTN|nr:hypothetical protein [Baekduia soli]QEC48569.1 hypothetical protein FSW04_13985 [Baekduia soli]
MDFPGGDTAAYDRVIERMGLADGKPPAGALFHMAGATDEGFRVVDIWESVDAYRRFAERQIGPLSSAEGFPSPRVSIWEIHNTMSTSPLVAA